MISSVSQIVDDVKKGKIFILVDEENRENEGDLVCAAELITPEIINFMITHARGGLCLTITQELQEKLLLDLLPKRNVQKNMTNFANSFDAYDVDTGVSIYEREKSIKTALRGDSDAISTPGHILPIVAHAEGLKMRKGHTEGSVEVMKLAGCKEHSAVITEILREDGEMARIDDLKEFAKLHNINILCMTDLLEYIDKHES